MDIQSWRQNLKSEAFEISGVRRRHATTAMNPERCSQMGIENAFAAQLVLLHPVQSHFDTLLIRMNLLNFPGIPPKKRSLDGLGHGKWFFKSSRIRNHMDKLRQNLRYEPKQLIRLNNFSLKQCSCSIMKRRFSHFHLHQERRIDSNHDCDISSKRSSSRFKGRCTRPTEAGW